MFYIQDLQISNENCRLDMGYVRETCIIGGGNGESECIGASTRDRQDELDTATLIYVMKLGLQNDRKRIL